MTKLIEFVLLFSWAVVFIECDKPCARREVPAKPAIVCVCNETYCDEINREIPSSSGYVSYTTSKAGSRFQKTVGKLQPSTSDEHLNDHSEDTEVEYVLDLDPETVYQTVEGFGGAVTDSSSMNWKNLSQPLQKHLIDSYFSDKGLEYNMLRVPIGGCDFSTHPYAYNELPENDTKLSNFTLTEEDLHFKIPMIKAIMNTSRTPIHIVATTWSPPVWMKTNAEITGRSRLKKEYYQTYADYHYKFVEKYAEQGVKVWAITTTNEPTNGLVPLAPFNSLGWTASDMGQWIVENLGPTIRNSSFHDLKIITVDDQRYSIPYFFNLMLLKHESVIDWVDGVGVHYYGDFLTPPSVFSLITETYPKLFIIGTEACEGYLPWSNGVDLGSWTRAEHYLYDIIIDLNHNVAGWMDWNLCLNEMGGPNWAKNYVDSPIIVFPERGEFYKQPMFYAMGHFSKFIPRGSRRIQVDEKKVTVPKSVKNVAFLTPDEKTVVVVLYNNGDAKRIKIKLGNKEMALNLEESSVTTVEISHDKL